MAQFSDLLIYAQLSNSPYLSTFQVFIKNYSNCIDGKYIKLTLKNIYNMAAIDLFEWLVTYSKTELANILIC